MIARIRVDKALPSLANSRLHWRALAKTKKDQRKAVHVRWKTLPFDFRWTMTVTKPIQSVLFVRTGPRFLDDDNLASAFKAVRDEVAKLLGVSDAPGGPVQWRYEQRKGKPGFEVEFHAEVKP